LIKRAPWVALASLALFVVANAWRHEDPPPPVQAQSTMDFSGMDALDLEWTLADVVLVAPGEAHGIDHALDHPPAITRKGRTLVVKAEREDSVIVHAVRAPHALRRIRTHGGSITAQVPVSALEIETAQNLQWAGDAKALRFESVHGNIEIGKGRVESLYVRLGDGEVTFLDPSGIGKAHLELGPKARYSFGRLRGPPPPIVIVPFHESAPEHTSPPVEHAD
jgi:hypothetical protein